MRSDQFLVARIDARNGAMGIVPASLEGGVVSNDFLPFAVDRSRLWPAYLGWLSRSEEFVASCRLASEGTTNRVRLSERRLLDVRVPLPSLDEQHELAHRLETIDGLTGRLTTAMADSVASQERLIAALELEIWPPDALVDAPHLQQVTTYLSRGRESRQGESGHYLIKTQHVQMGRYLPTRFSLAPDVAARVPPEAHVQPGDTLIACSAAGCLGRVALYDADGIPGSTDTHVAIARPDRDRVLPRYLYRYLVGAQGQRQLRSRERGDWEREKVGFRLIELNLRDLQQVPVPLPSIAEQAAILTRLARVDAWARKVRRARIEQLAQAAGLLPAVLHTWFQH